MIDFGPSARTVSEILDESLAGRRISAGDAHRLLLDGELLALGEAAQAVRDRHHDPAVATYNVDFYLYLDDTFDSAPGIYYHNPLGTQFATSVADSDAFATCF